MPSHEPGAPRGSPLLTQPFLGLAVPGSTRRTVLGGFLEVARNLEATSTNLQAAARRLQESLLMICRLLPENFRMLRPASSEGGGLRGALKEASCGDGTEEYYNAPDDGTGYETG